MVKHYEEGFQDCTVKLSNAWLFRTYFHAVDKGEYTKPNQNPTLLERELNLDLINHIFVLAAVDAFNQLTNLCITHALEHSMTLNSTQKRVLASHHFDFGQVDDMLPYTLLPFDSNVEMATQSLAFAYLCDDTEFERSMLDFELFMGELEITVHKFKLYDFVDYASIGEMYKVTEHLFEAITHLAYDINHLFTLEDYDRDYIVKTLLLVYSNKKDVQAWISNKTLKLALHAVAESLMVMSSFSEDDLSSDRSDDQWPDDDSSSIPSASTVHSESDDSESDD